MNEKDRFSEMKGRSVTNTLLEQPYIKNCSYLFYGSERLEEIPAIYEICKYATDMSYMFAANCGTDIDLHLEKLNTSHVKTMSYMFANIGTLSCWEHFDVTRLDTSNVEDLSHFFHGCHALQTVNINGINTQNVKNMEGMFFGTGAINLDISALNTDNVTTVSGMFASNYDLISLNTNSSQFANVSNFSNMFKGDSSLKEIPVFSVGVKANNLEEMFSGCKALTSAGATRNWDFSNVSTVEGMFSGCSELRSIPTNYWHFGKDKLRVVTDAFSGCSNLTSLNLSSWDVGNTYEFSGLFKGCSNLTNIDLSTWQIRQEPLNIYPEYFEDMFNGCTNLKVLKLGSIPKFKYSNPKNMFKGVPTDCLIEVPDAEIRYRVRQLGNFTNVVIKEQETT